MPRNISEETKEKIWDLFQQGKSYDDIASITKTSYTTAWAYSHLRKIGFSSRSDYELYLIKTKRGYKSRVKYDEAKAREKGYKSHAEYSKSLSEERQQRDVNLALSCFLAEKSEEQGISQSELARQICVSRQIVSVYFQGKTLPGGEILKKIFSVLQVNYRTIDDLFESKK